ncbi:MAG: bifunctional (p)ppGpp synthetase/guanosine-3',5'-bis(diphosphate) 3'-pyrophosphohydrolase [Candidatus Marinimicrobia bacterium]|jgi:GTP pyrophosphokinase|nr:bifunctional (p)ppGpp synthetase/guanosine-3',5'-bis(diphosphate) 3'-pyrophosphohydrolase [Candidatus Neomarinimicrobiota bacterium]MBT3501405.1 bifunctional (p)ppGpp synthetase/guanosine-3',5'-bis(diphosphate) 3'-pyrophosphohydrolase [Candidatus Neomarinimicrobiota bacterium]MBT3839456.1 bifunctional (p)ppGpp synthetase/guanosine-3',5'-bis(diphosphate) 3'-pyrophosphohydrolase [Candidatus Neomarinimicrobiota bacterium]MBT3998559.1 bifunctional (p)ppGpp synthetase/guanosine-3',5'-bis(diphospha
MDNPLSRLVPNLFGEYPNSFIKLVDIVSANSDLEREELTPLLWKAYEFGDIHHEGQKRRSGKPYYSHCVSVAQKLASWKMDTTTIIAGLLHDTVEDTDVTVDMLRNEFGDDLANLVDGVTKLGGIQFSSRKEKQAGNFMKMLLSVAKDLRVVIIKFADRLHNMETIKYMPKIKQHRIAVETRDVYVPLAHRLGMFSVKAQLEDIVFSILNPKAYKDLSSKIKSSKKQRDIFINGFIGPVDKELKNYNISPKVFGRSKSYASIHGKMIKRDTTFEEIYDLYAIRIIVDKIEQCYLALGIVHSLYNPIQGRFKDFIANPKSNGYQSVHTTVVDPKGKKIEIQIRTTEMDETAEIGVAKHWVYKGNKSSDVDKNVKWLRELLEILQNESADPKEFMDLLKIDLYKEEIFVFTPAGDLIQLPIGSSPVDFAFQVHTQVGMHCMGAKINHSVVPLNTKLTNGDMVEIITSKKQMPSYGWQKFIVTSKARNQINRYLKKIQDEESVKLGEEMLTKTLRRMKMLKDIEEFRDNFHRFGYSDKNALLKAIGSGVITIRDMLLKLRPQEEDIHKSTEEEESSKFFDFARSKSKGIILDGIDNLMVNFGKCCNPIPGDELIGFITRGRGITVHQSACKSLPLLSHESDRLITVEWNVKSSDNFDVRLRVVGQDYKGALKDMSECISKQNVNIASVDITVKESVSIAHFIVQVNNNRQLNRLIRKMTKLKNIDYVERAGR